MASTIKDIANKTGLGLATVSSYLNGGNVRDYNREKIEQAIKELNFEVNETARGLKTNSTKTIGVIIPELSNLFFTEIISKASDILRINGYATLVCDCRTNELAEKEAIEFLYKKRVDGLLISPVCTSGKYLKKFADKKPVVIIDRFLEDINCSSVIVENRTAVKDAVRFFVENGHHKIGFIGGPKETYTVRERVGGYLEGLKEENLVFDSNLLIHTDYSIEGGCEGTKKLISKNPDMTAILVSNYETTVGALIAIKELGMRVPEDISVIGYDNVEFAKAYNPTLTIITQPTKEIAKQAAMTLLSQMKGKEAKTGITEDSKLQATLFYGDSVKKHHSFKTKPNRFGFE